MASATATATGLAMTLAVFGSLPAEARQGFKKHKQL
jgi:hypothetical protein